MKHIITASTTLVLMACLTGNSITGVRSAEIPATDSADSTPRLEKITLASVDDRIDSALVKLKENGILILETGTYLISEPLQIDKDIEIAGSTGKPQDVVIKSRGKGCVILNANKARIRGVTLQVKVDRQLPESVDFDSIEESERKKMQDDVESHSAIHILKGKCELLQCRVTSDYGYGAIIDGPNTDCRLYECRFFDTPMSCLYFTDQAKGRIENCLFEKSGAGAILSAGSAPSFSSCDFHGMTSGVLVSENSTGVFINCKFHDNFFGFSIGSQADPLLHKCRFYKNGRGLYISDKGKGKIVDSDIFDNDGKGIVMYQDAKPSFIDCRIRDNSRTGIDINLGSEPSFVGCQIHDNSGNGIELCDANGVFHNCDIYANERTGIRSVESSFTLYRCRIHENESGLDLEKGNYLVQACTIRDNKNEAIAAEESTPLLIDNEIEGDVLFDGKPELVTRGGQQADELSDTPPDAHPDARPEEKEKEEETASLTTLLSNERKEEENIPLDPKYIAIFENEVRECQATVEKNKGLLDAHALTMEDFEEALLKLQEAEYALKKARTHGTRIIVGQVDRLADGKVDPDYLKLLYSRCHFVEEQLRRYETLLSYGAVTDGEMNEAKTKLYRAKYELDIAEEQ